MAVHEFYVPKEVIEDFAIELDEKQIENQIEGVTEDSEIIVKVWYDKKDKNSVYKLHEMIDEYNGDKEESEE